MVNSKIEKVKKLQLEILKYVDKICNQNGIKYYLIGGTLLGAVRHKGFIPWDDDIDIGLLRKDYNNLIKQLCKENNPKFFVQNFYTDSRYPRYITKLRVNGTKFIEETTKSIDMNHGIFIDIFPLDKIQEKNKLVLDFRAKIGKTLLTLRMIRNGKLNIKNVYKKILAKLIRPFTFILPLEFYNKLIDFIYSYSNDKDCMYVTNFSSQYGWRKQTFPIDVYGEGTYLEFEGHQFMAPDKWEVILKSLYGDYKKLPPEEKRNSGHNVVHIDLGKYK